MSQCAPRAFENSAPLEPTYLNTTATTASTDENRTTDSTATAQHRAPCLPACACARAELRERERDEGESGALGFGDAVVAESGMGTDQENGADSDQ